MRRRRWPERIALYAFTRSPTDIQLRAAKRPLDPDLPSTDGGEWFMSQGDLLANDWEVADFWPPVDNTNCIVYTELILPSC